MAIHFSVIIPSKDRQEILRETLEHLSRTTNLDRLQVIIVNDSAQPIALPENFSFATVYPNKGSGVASARNTGFAQAVHPWTVFMDDDIWVQPQTFEQLEHFCTGKDRCMLANWVYPPYLQQQQAVLPFLRYLHRYGLDSLQGWSSDIQWNQDVVFKVSGVTSQFLLMHREVFLKTGRYNEQFPFAGFEDYDFSRRLREAGIDVYIDPHNLVFHNERDRMDMVRWLERQQRGAITRKVAAGLGYKEVALHYSWLKQSAYRLAYAFRKPMLKVLKAWPAEKRWDRLFFFCMNVLLGAYACVGYTQKKGTA